jgi:tetratricopeptide (TPR) repeat protein
MLSPPDSVQWNALARELLRGSPPHVEAVLGALRSGPTPSPARYLETQEAANERVELVCAAQLRCGLGDPGGSGGGSGEGWRDGGSAADAEALALGAGGGELEDSERPRAAWSLAAWCVHQDPTRPTAWRQFAAAAHSRAIVTAFERGVDSPAAQRALSSALLLLLETLPALSGVEDAQARIARVAVAVECLVLRARGDDLARAERLMESELKGAGGVTHRLAARLSLRRGDRATAVARYREAALAAAAAAPRAGEMRVVSVLEPLSERGAWVWMELAAVLSTEGDTEGARSALEQAVRAAESASCRTAALVRLAKLQYFTRQYRQGEEAVQAALALSPHDPVCLFVMGLFHRKAKRWADAVQCFERALQCTVDAPLVSTTRPRVPLANLQLALCHGKQKDMDVAVAEEDLLFELEVSPRLPAAHYQLALLALRRLQESFPGGRPVSDGGGGGEAATLAAAAEDYESIHASARRSLAVAAHLAPVGAVLWRQLSSLWSRAE